MKRSQLGDTSGQTEKAKEKFEPRFEGTRISGTRIFRIGRVSMLLESNDRVPIVMLLLTNVIQIRYCGVAEVPWRKASDASWRTPRRNPECTRRKAKRKEPMVFSPDTLLFRPWESRRAPLGRFDSYEIGSAYTDTSPSAATSTTVFTIER